MQTLHCCKRALHNYNNRCNYSRLKNTLCLQHLRQRVRCIYAHNAATQPLKPAH